MLKKRKSGFTLIELLGTLIIMGIVALITIPPINKTIKESNVKLYNQQISTIELSAGNWGTDNRYILPVNEGDCIYITLGQLKIQGFVEMNIKNPITKKLYPNNMLIEIKRENNNYYYKVVEGSGTDDGGEIDENTPIIVLKGSQTVHVEINTQYEETGFIALKPTGEKIDEVTKTYYYEDKEVSSINTKLLGTYQIDYSVSNGEYKASIRRTVIVEDTIPPTLLVDGKNVSYLTDVEAGTFNVFGYQVSDNSQFEGSLYQDSLKVNITSEVNSKIEGIYPLTYTATDYSGNKTTIKVSVNIKDTIPPSITFSESLVKVRVGTDYNPVNSAPITVVDSGTGVKSVVAKYNDQIITNTKNLPVGTYSIIFVATDNAKLANTASAGLTVQIYDLVLKYRTRYWITEINDVYSTGHYVGAASSSCSSWSRTVDGFPESNPINGWTCGNWPSDVRNFKYCCSYSYSCTMTAECSIYREGTSCYTYTCKTGTSDNSRWSDWSGWSETPCNTADSSTCQSQWMIP